MVEAAAETFSARGYAASTLDDVAAAAGVSADTVAAVGSKAFLLLEAFRARYAGRGGWQSLLEDRDVQQILEITDRDEGIEAAAGFVVRGHRSSARLWLVVRATALTDPEVAEGFAELGRLKVESFRETTRWLARIGVVHGSGAAFLDDDDPELQRLSTEVNLILSAETYLLLTEDYGLDDAAYRGWVTRSLDTGIR